MSSAKNSQKARLFRRGFFQTRYGGRKAYLHLWKSRIAHLLGVYSRWHRVDFSRVKRLVFVCKGNISRSPYAEAVARSHGLISSSFGIHGDSGKPAESKALEIALARNRDLTEHRARSIREFDFHPGDLILCFEPGHARVIEQSFSNKNRQLDLAQISLLGLWSAPIRPLIWDPYGLSDSYYRTCYQLVDTAVDNLAAIIGANAVDAA